MQRNFFSINKCSHNEQKLLKALRALNWEGSWPTQAGFLLEELGIFSVHAFPFARLVQAIVNTNPNFNWLGPNSPFVSKDEIELLSALGHSARSLKTKTTGVAPLLPTDIQTLLDICGEELRSAKVAIKPRAVLKSFKEMVAKSAKQANHNFPYLLTQVASIEQLTPAFKRVVLTGKALKDFAVEYPAQWVKVFLPNNKMTGRAYTVRYFDAAKQQLTLDIATNHHGLISSWAMQAKIGDELYIAGPRGGFKDLAIEDSWLLLLADETGIPSIAAILEQLPAHLKVYVYLEASNKQEQQQLTTKADASIHWIFKDSQQESLKTVLKSNNLPASQGHAWIAAEASLIRNIRIQLLKERGFSLGNIQTTGYWKLGEKDHKDLAAIL